MAVDFQWTAGCYIPGDEILHNHNCRDLKSYIFEIMLLLGNEVNLYIVARKLLAPFSTFVGKLNCLMRYHSVCHTPGGD
jgi:hypothetical protein